MSEVTTAYYLRMTAEDRPGVLSQIAQIMSDNGLSIEAVIQREPSEDKPEASIIMLTNRVQEKQLSAAINSIEALDSIDGEVTHIRVEALG